MVEAVRRICVVDDDEGIRESLRFLFEEAGYVVEEAADGESALALLRRDHRPRVLLLDRMMPRLDGPHVLRELVQEPQMSMRTSIIFMTARNDPPDPETERLLEAHTIAAVGKPFNLDGLLATVEHAWLLVSDQMS